MEPDTLVGSELTVGTEVVLLPPLLLHAVSTTMVAAITATHPLRISPILRADRLLNTGEATSSGPDRPPWLLDA
uniref:Uncharacterized protein n=1 Tax=Kitasatospora sp. CMC57 TaxID=3231513 RepID=A0AB33JV12_9ACTN